ncbi:MAG: flagellar motor switch protein FliN, partial [Oscillospiraceae bacterium]|nr:flagellar motor switch protein FliN [Oscillospiraceae bacterium]
YPPPGYPPAPGYPPPGYPPPGYGYPPPVEYRPAQFGSFDNGPVMVSGENMDLLMDVPLQVAVELGKSKKYIKEVIDFNVGSIIVLDKMAGELVDVIVNGKLIAKGEVVVIDENYGVRVTDIISPSKRING